MINFFRFFTRGHSWWLVCTFRQDCWRIDTPEVESCENIPELEGGKQRVKMNSMKRENDNMNLPRS